MIGLERHELEWVRLVVKLLRHPDPLASELVRQALTYVSQVAEPGAGLPSDEPAVAWQSGR